MAGYDIFFPHLGIGIEHLKSNISIFGFRVAFYGIIIGIGMLLGILIARTDYKRRGFNPEDIEDLALFAIVFCIIGARIYYVAFEWDYYSQHPSEIFAIRNGGLAIYGGIITAVICCSLFCKHRKINFFQIADSGILGLITGQIVGRWGNFFNAEAFGRYTDSLLAMQIRLDIVNPNMLNHNVLSHLVSIGGADYIQVHPTFFYESFWNLCALIVLWLSGPKKKFTGQIFWGYFFFYGVGRFWIEGLRTDSLYLWGTTIPVSQLLSGIMAVVSACIILWNWRHPEKLVMGIPKKEMVKAKTLIPEGSVISVAQETSETSTVSAATKTSETSTVSAATKTSETTTASAATKTSETTTASAATKTSETSTASEATKTSETSTVSETSEVSEISGTK